MHVSRSASIVIVAALSIAAGLAGCRQRERAPEAPVPMPVLMSTGGQDGEMDRTRIFIARRPMDLLPLGQDVLEDLDIDFDTQTAIVVSLGQRETAGHWVRIHSAQLENNKLYVQFTINEPDDDQMTAQVITHPWAVATIPRVGDDVRIHPEPEHISGAEAPEDVLPGGEIP